MVLAMCTGNDVSDNSSALDTDSWLNGERCRPYFAHRGGELVETSEFRDVLLPHLWCRSNFALSESAIVRVIGDPIVLMHSSVNEDPLLTKSVGRVSLNFVSREGGMLERTRTTRD